MIGFRISARRRGGAAFNMLMFLLLLISSGLMYYYFNRCKTLERELAQWKTGETPHGTAMPVSSELPSVAASPVASAERKTDAMSAFKTMATNLGARITGTPVVKPIVSPVAGGTANEDPAPDASARLDLADHTPAVSRSSIPAIEATPTPTPAVSESVDARDLPVPEATPDPSDSASRSGAAPRPDAEKAAAQSPARTATPQTAKSTPIGSLYDVAPQVRVKAPRRSPTPEQQN